MNITHFKQHISKKAANSKKYIATLTNTVRHLALKSFTFIKQHSALPAGLALLIVIPFSIRLVIWQMPVSNTSSAQTNNVD